MPEPDREIRMGINRLHLAEDGVLHITVVGEQDEKTSRSTLNK